MPMSFEWPLFSLDNIKVQRNLKILEWPMSQSKDKLQLVLAQSSKCKERLLLKNQYSKRNLTYFENKCSSESSKIGFHYRQSVLKIEVVKDCQ